MITYLDGTLAEKQPTRVVMDVGGVGYEVLIPLSSYDRLPKQESRLRLLIHDYVREDSHQLFGFATSDERRMFRLLLGITGIGPKLALSALSGLHPRELKAAVVESDVRRLSSISGIGRKTAERIVLDLRDKLDPGEAIEAVAGRDAPGDSTTRDAVLALIALGYKQEEAQKMIAAARKTSGAEGAGVEDLIKLSLGGQKA